MRRSIGFVLIVIAVTSLLVSLYGLVQIWTLRQPVAAATVAGVDLFTEMLDTTSDALKVTSESIQSASDTVTLIERTSLSVAQTLSTTHTTVGSLAGLMGKDMPTSIDATRTALQSAQSSAVVVDNVLTTLSRVPLINIQQIIPPRGVHGNHTRLDLPGFLVGRNTGAGAAQGTGTSQRRSQPINQELTP